MDGCDTVTAPSSTGSAVAVRCKEPDDGEREEIGAVSNLYSDIQFMHLGHNTVTRILT